MILQVKNFPTETHKTLKKACIDADCELKDIIAPAIAQYLSTGKHLKNIKQ